MSKSICIITGSTLGGAEYVADNLNDVLTAQGFEVELYNQAELADIQHQSNLLVVTSTHGAGELPENIQPLFADLLEQRPDFSQMKFGVIGLGSSDYDTFCNAVNIVEETLSSLGATQVCESLRIDVVSDFDHDGSAEAWLPNLVEKL
ncbi:FMN-binding protein MioC [Ursidibacter maritimus]|uniref:FMN-binding protein MioC n=1 Tax=Ursidibacter maritimus TaxID=1331689 RepID=A0A949WNU3_9PAST|nr:FMN-binding protein MioC [Ursidibacter maritimus]KAE9538741.1 FMN-binding protein MioC [Ursidibacter maritimus]MBV6523362.1 FMN-binding protein MioC [Ursidibacter maritimus]MBV6526437.1 FMN-binding protein MioC [Ursidibacter maritimus]MBV6527768.1 FMN-binding protein MioC [Ursidibacter maritimus]MBV6529789.1 FMN-binding protein MioC [Ursidibacter maritimus]